MLCIMVIFSSPCIPETVFVELNFTTMSLEFSFENVMYMQIDGISMGSSLGPVMANIFMGLYEKRLSASAS